MSRIKPSIKNILNLSFNYDLNRYYSFLILLFVTLWIMFLIFRSCLYVYRIVNEDLTVSQKEYKLFSSFINQPLEQKYLYNYQNLDKICTKQ